MNTKFIIILFFLNIFSPLYAANNKLISFGDVQVGADRINLDLNDFEIIIKTNKIPIKAIFIKDSVQWIRNQSNLLTPRARLQIEVKNKASTIHASYLGESIIPEKIDNSSNFDLYIDLFNPDSIIIKKQKTIIGEVSVRVTNISEKIKTRKQKTKLIDYSCSRYQLEFKGLEHEYMSIGCKLERVGSWGEETPRLVVSWSTTNYRLIDGSSPPFKVILHTNNPASIYVVDRKGKPKKITIKAKLPERLHRLKTAFGFGPYFFKASNELETRNNRVAPALMFYGRYDLIKTTSMRFFNATIASGSLFNNAGLYFAYALAGAFDGRIELVPLLGAQVLSFDFDGNTDAYHEIIYPQGAEIVWNNAFNIENYLVTYGMFLSTSSSKHYQNLWIRWGKGYFWEINYINWEQDTKKAKMWGLSIGLPFFQAF